MYTKEEINNKAAELINQFGTLNAIFHAKKMVENSYMIDVRYTRDYNNYWNEILTTLHNLNNNQK